MIDSTQIAEFDATFQAVFPEFMLPLAAICVVGIVVSCVKKFVRW